MLVCEMAPINSHQPHSINYYSVIETICFIFRLFAIDFARCKKNAYTLQPFVCEIFSYNVRFIIQYVYSVQIAAAVWMEIKNKNLSWEMTIKYHTWWSEYRFCMPILLWCSQSIRYKCTGAGTCLYRYWYSIVYGSSLWRQSKRQFTSAAVDDDWLNHLLSDIWETWTESQCVEIKY